MDQRLQSHHFYQNMAYQWHSGCGTVLQSRQTNKGHLQKQRWRCVHLLYLIKLLMITCRPFLHAKGIYINHHSCSLYSTRCECQASTDKKKTLCAVINKQLTTNPKGVFIIAEDFNHCNLRTVLPRFHQNLSCPTRWHNTLDHVYTNVAEVYKTITLSHLGQFDHFLCFCFLSTPPS